MRQKLTVVVSDNGCTPYANVPCDCMWDLIEYLSYQRVSVHYNFKDTYFTVSFPRQNLTAAQEFLDHWAAVDLAKYAHTG